MSALAAASGIALRSFRRKRAIGAIRDHGLACRYRKQQRAMHRFGLRPRAGAIEAIASDPQSALMAELDRPGAGLVTIAELPSSGGANRAVFEFNAERNA
jgi:uncharacterized protein (DUF1800 family)